MFVVQAIGAFDPNGFLGSASRNTRVTFHFLLMFCGVVSALLGYAAIYYTKEKFEKPHLTTPHGQLGFNVIIYLVVQSLAGINVSYPQLATKLVSYGLLRRMHGYSGLFLFLLSSLVMLGGINSDWFKERVTGIAWYMCVVAPFLLLALLLKQVLLKKPTSKPADAKKAK